MGGECRAHLWRHGSSVGRGGVCFPFRFNWKLEFLDKGETESYLAEFLLSARAK